MTRLAWTLALALSTTLPLAAQGITGPGKTDKSAPPRPAEVLDELRAWAARGDYVLAAPPLIAVVREPVKVIGLGGLDAEARLALKRALTLVEGRIRTTVKGVAAGEVSPARARAEIRGAVETYTATLRTLMRPRC